MAKLQICQFSSVQPLNGKSGKLYSRVVVCHLSPVICHTFDSSDVTLAFGDAQVIPPGWDDGLSDDFLRTFWGLSEDFLRT